MKTLEELGNEWRNSYSRIVNETKGRVARWEFKSSQYYWPGPLGFERRQLPRGRTVKNKAQAKSHYGYDAQGRLIYVGVQSGICNWDEHCTSFVGEVAETAVFQSNTWQGKITNQLLSVYRTFFANGREQSLERMGFVDYGSAPAPGTRASSLETYQWSDDQLIRIQHSGKVNGKIVEGDRFDISYDVTGEICSLIKTFFPGGAVQRLIQKKAVGVTLASLVKGIQARLRAAVLAAAAKSGIKERIYAVVLAYDGEAESPLPPVVGFGLESERTQWLGGIESKALVWNPAEWTHYEKKHTQLKDPKLDELTELLNTQLEAKGSSAPAKKLLLETCRDMAGERWPFPTTPDFVIYCVDFEMIELSKNLKALLSPKQLAEFKRAKLL